MGGKRGPSTPTLVGMERHARQHRLLSRLGLISATVAVLAASVPASATAWAEPAPRVAAAAIASRDRVPTERTARVAQAIYDSLPIPDSSRLLAAEAAAHQALVERLAAASMTTASAQAMPISTAPATVRTVAPPTRTAAPRPAAPRPAAPTYSGSNHMWFPALGINHSVVSYACNASYALSYTAVYRWGCAGANNVYLLAHAGGPFRPLYDAYNAGRLSVGMLVVYADGGGTIHYYKLQWWKTTPPDGDVYWAYAPQPVPSLTLQTCVGADSSLRLVARFVEVSRP